MSVATPVSFKDSSVHAKGLQPQLLLGLFIVAGVFQARGIPLVVTSLNDGTHNARSARHPRSLHYDGCAADLRLPSRYTGAHDSDESVLRECRAALGSDFDLVLEIDHLHLEYDPKEGA